MDRPAINDQMTDMYRYLAAKSNDSSSTVKRKRSSISEDELLVETSPQRSSRSTPKRREIVKQESPSEMLPCCDSGAERRYVNIPCQHCMRRLATSTDESLACHFDKSGKEFKEGADLACAFCTSQQKRNKRIRSRCIDVPKRCEDLARKALFEAHNGMMDRLVVSVKELDQKMRNGGASHPCVSDLSLKESGAESILESFNLVSDTISTERSESDTFTLRRRDSYRPTSFIDSYRPSTDSSRPSTHPDRAANKSPRPRKSSRLEVDAMHDKRLERLLDTMDAAKETMRTARRRYEESARDLTEYLRERY